MIRIVLVDDDVLALTRLKQLIRLEDVQVAGEFTQAEQALEFLKREKADILITDMRMPKVDGIELIRRIKEAEPDVQLIAVSSYEDFHYVKMSFKEGSIDYILKHALNEESLTKALMEAIARVHAIRENKDRTSPSPDEGLAAESRQALKNQLLTLLLKGEIQVDEARERMDKHGIHLRLGSAIVVACEIDGYRKTVEGFEDKDKSIFLSSVHDLMERVLAKVPEKEIVRAEEGRYALILSYPHVKSHLFIYSATYEYCGRLISTLGKMLNIKLSVGIGGLCSDIADIPASYRKCLDMLDNKLFEGAGKVFDAQRTLSKPVGAGNGSSARIPINQDEIYGELTEGSTGYRDTIEGLFQRFSEGKIPLQIIQLHLVDLLNAGFKAIKSRELLKLQEEYSFNLLYQEVHAAETIEEMKRIILDFYEAIANAALEHKRMQERNYNKHTIRAIEIIERDYAKAISLQDVADEFGVHHTYLSKVFKADTSHNFTEFLSGYRIDKAKRLIETGKYRLKEIYGRVGFNQYNYFFKVFRQVTGLTPTEYERQTTKK